MYAWYMPIPSTGRARLVAQSFCWPLLEVTLTNISLLAELIAWLLAR